MGATIAQWSPPRGATIDTVGSALQNAALALQNYLDGSGVPPKSKADPVVMAFQRAWDADSVAGVARIDVDGGYGENTYEALNALTGLAQPPGSHPSPSPSPPSPTPPGVLPAPLKTTTHEGLPWGEIALVGGGLALVYFLFFRKKRGRKGTTIELKSNPRRKRGRGRRAPSLL